MIPIAKPYFGDEEKNAVMNVLDSGMIASGSVVDEFQSEFASYVGVEHGAAASNGTTALEILLRASGIKKGDKIITTPFSFIASTNCIIYVGAIPVFVDIDPVTFNISPDLVEKILKNDPDIKAILIVHLFGHPCDMDEFIKLSKKYNVLLFEDCAQSHGALYKGKMTGSFGDASAFSFYPTKNMTTSEGGMIVSDNNEIIEKARLLINHGMSVRYYHDEIGYNYRMTNIAAAIGLCQLKKLDSFNKKRNEIAKYYNKNITNSLISKPSKIGNIYHCYHQYSILISEEKRDLFIKHMQQHNIGCAIFYPLSIPEQKCYKKFNFEKNYPITNQIKSQIVSIPIHPQLINFELENVTNVINNFI